MRALAGEAVTSRKHHQNRAVRASDPSRAVVSYVDGTWTDRLVAKCLAIETDAGALRVVLRIAPRGAARSSAALEQFVAKHTAIDSILLLKPPYRGRIQAHVLGAENGELGVRLCAPGVEIVYPAAAVFGPDGITLTLG